MSGPAPKQPDQRQRRNRRTAAEGPSLVAMPRARSHPEAPKDWLEVIKQQWEAFWQSSLSGLLTPADFPALGRLFWLYDQSERVRRTVGGSNMLIKGSREQEVLNPLLRQLSVIHTEILQLEDRFGLTPMARLRLGVQFGEAARSLEDLSRRLDDDDDDLDVEDPRMRVLDQEG